MLNILKGIMQAPVTPMRDAELIAKIIQSARGTQEIAV
jgi:hypothetical protein